MAAGIALNGESRKEKKITLVFYLLVACALNDDVIFTFL